MSGRGREVRLAQSTWVIFERYLRQTLRTKIGVALGVLQPMLYLLFFAPLLDSWPVSVPGLLVQLVLLSAGLAGFGIIFDKRFGVLDRMRATPAPRLALLLGRVLRDVVVLLVQAGLIVLVGFALGLRVPVAGVALTLLLLVPLAGGVAAASYAVALRPGADELFAPLMSTVVVPLTLLSGAFLPMTLGPRWLDVLSRLDPFRYPVDALRELFAGRYTSGPVLLGTALTLAIAVGATTLGVRAFRSDPS
ncbi:ABC transporter permease [Cryptosporangium arvum]|uniref:ABC transporter permease n=1 Tax=Cryptosporangium arvum TaxID=80871 RepID=UPI0004BCA581|nr:ABC transporter permease [Cryptosporangium arvum]